MGAKKVIFGSLFAVLAIAILGTFGLVKDEFTIGNLCPKIFGIPACYIVFVCFIIAIIVHVLHFNHNTLIFYLSIGIVSMFASYGTLGELIGFAECPKTSNGIPMCFISLSICVVSLILKTLHIKIKTKST